MKKVRKIFVFVSLISAVLILLAFGVFMRNTNNFFSDYYNQQLDDCSSIFRKAIEMAEDYTEIYEHALADDLYHKLSVISQEMEGTPIDKVDTKKLEGLSEEYGLFGIAIFAKEPDGIFIYNSTVPGEIGKRTKEWGYWNEAFESLFAGEKPVVQEGHYYEHYWIGPRSKSHFEPGYFRYAYYYNAQQNYLINAVMRDNRAYGDNVINMLDDFFDHLDKEISYIEAVSLIDLSAWEKAYYNDYKNPEAPVFLYGNFDKDILVHCGLTPEDLYSIDYNQSMTFQYEGKSKTLFMVSASGKEHPYLIAILLDDQQAKGFIQHTLSAYITLLLFTLAILVVGIYYIVIRYKSLLTFQVERNEEVERFTKDIAALPEIAYKCKLQEGELLLTYNYGRSMHEEHKIPLESIYRPMKEIYSAEYVEAFRALVEPVFAGEAKRFEIAYHDGLYEHFTSPIVGKDGSVTEIIGIANNITDRKLQEEEAKYYASHDHLTGLVNRRVFEDTVHHQTNKDPDGRYAMMLIDLDGFKSVNDRFGHLAGDAVLKQAASRIKNAITTRAAAAVVARMGGDEFSAYIPYTLIQEVIDIANDTIASISEPYTLPDGSTRLGASIGVSLYPADSFAYGQLLHYADIAMYQAKMVEGGSQRFFSKSMCTEDT
ncbi:MAG: diguanylate cyclase domain-containing protein [Oscillospiraceae bacterium]|jgi:diguanylate cyclase (GGDEF)-like protein